MKNMILIFTVFFCQQTFAQWIKINGLDTCSINSVAVDKSNKTIYAVASKNNNFIGLFSQSNLSSPWVKIYKGLGSIAVNKIAITAQGSLYLATANGVYIVENNDTCISINQGLPNNLGNYPSVNTIAVIDSFLYAGTNDGIFRTSLIGTVNWQNFSQNLPTGISANRILKYRNQILASYSNNVYGTDLNTPNWTAANSISNGQGSFPPTINDMAAGDNTVYLAVEGGWSNGYKSLNDSMVFSPCATTSDLTAYSAYAAGNDFWIGTFYGGIYKGSGIGSDLSVSNPNLPAWTTVKSIAEYESSLIVGTEYYSFQSGSGGLYYKGNVTLATLNNNFSVSYQGEFVKIVWESQNALGIERFELEKYDNISSQFKTIKTFPPANSSYNYFYNDYDIYNLKDNFLYRLKTVNLSGETSYSQIIRVKVKNDKILISPNPAKNKINLHLPNFINARKCTVQVYTSAGLLKIKKNDLIQNEFSIDLSTLSKGIYFLKIASAEFSYSKAIILQ